MFMIIVAGIGLVALTMVIHAVGTASLIYHIARHHSQPDGHIEPRKVLQVIIGTAIWLMLLHVLEILLWAFAYVLLVPSPRLDTFEEATYFSFVTFTTLGYGDITLGVSEWRLLSGIEALNGILLVGWSTALLYAVVQRSWRGLSR
jgi:hypothetical protein